MEPPPTRAPRVAAWLAVLVPFAACGGSDAPVPARAAGSRAEQNRPDLALLVADDLGWSDLGCYGGEIPTPAIDALAARGLRFRDFYTNGVCGPTRASLLYGVYCQQLGHSGRLWDAPLDTSRATPLAELLGSAGYRTLAVGKWQGGQHPLDAGFERFFGPLSSGPISYFDAVRPNPFFLDREPYELPAEFYLTDALAERAVELLLDDSDGTDERPVFLYLAFVAPHWPLHAREADVAPHRARYRELGWDRAHAERIARQRALGLAPEAWTSAPRPEFVDPWEAAVEPAWQAERMAVYAAQVAGLDRAVGRVLAALERRGDGAAVFFLSDNGADLKGGQRPDATSLIADEEAGWRLDGGSLRPGSGPDVLPGPRDTFAAFGPAWAWVSNAPFRGYKSMPNEGGLRAPLIACLPGLAAPGGITTQVAHAFDLYPTLLELAHVEPPSPGGPRALDPLDGQSLAGLLRGGEGPGARELAFALRGLGLRSGDWKLVARDRRSGFELYDLSTDAGETSDLAAAEPERVEVLARALMAWRQRVDER